MVIWKPIPRYEGRYEASDTGEVRSVIGGKCQVLQQMHHIAGYCILFLYNSNHWKRKEFVHRLVAEAFLENPLSHPFVNHKNSRKKDNTVSNLEWMSCAENTQHYWDTNAEKRKRIMASNASF